MGLSARPRRGAAIIYKVAADRQGRQVARHTPARQRGRGRGTRRLAGAVPQHGGLHLVRLALRGARRSARQSLERTAGRSRATAVLQLLRSPGGVRRLFLFERRHFVRVQLTQAGLGTACRRDGRWDTAPRRPGRHPASVSSKGKQRKQTHTTHHTHTPQHAPHRPRGTNSHPTLPTQKYLHTYRHYVYTYFL